MNKYNNLSPTHSFVLSINSTDSNVQPNTSNIFKYRRHLISVNCVEDASKAFSKYFDFSVNEDEIEYLGEGIVKYED